MYISYYIPIREHLKTFPPKEILFNKKLKTLNNIYIFTALNNSDHQWWQCVAGEIENKSRENKLYLNARTGKP